ncbi:putative RNA helicase [Trypanosoma cruzi]|nr:putative RNA helicase [Trypanosoma cruzi]
MHTGDYVLYAQSRSGKGGGVAVAGAENSPLQAYTSHHPQHDTSLEVVVVQVALDQNRDLIVASAYMRPHRRVTQSFRRLVKSAFQLDAASAVRGFQHASPTVEPFLETSPSEVAADF